VAVLVTRVRPAKNHSATVYIEIPRKFRVDLGLDRDDVEPEEVFHCGQVGSGDPFPQAFLSGFIFVRRGYAFGRSA
jgi:hypothetical protein